VTDNTEQRAAVANAAYKALRNFKMGNMCQEDEPSAGYPLVDLCSDKDGDISSGEDQLRDMAAEVADAILAAQPAPLGEDLVSREAAAKICDERAAMREQLFNENGASINAAKAVEAEEIGALIRRLPAPLPTDPIACAEGEKLRAAIRKTEYKYFGDYEMSDDQRAAVDTLVEFAERHLAMKRTAEGWRDIDLPPFIVSDAQDGTYLGAETWVEDLLDARRFYSRDDAVEAATAHGLLEHPEAIKIQSFAVHDGPSYVRAGYLAALSPSSPVEGGGA